MGVRLSNCYQKRKNSDELLSSDNRIDKKIQLKSGNRKNYDSENNCSANLQIKENEELFSKMQPKEEDHPKEETLERKKAEISTSVISNSKLINFYNGYCNTNEDKKRKKENISDINLTEKLRHTENTYTRVKFIDDKNLFFLYEKAHSLFSEKTSNSLKSLKNLSHSETEEVNTLLNDFFTFEEQELKHSCFLDEFKIEAIIDELYSIYEDNIIPTNEKNTSIEKKQLIEKNKRYKSTSTKKKMDNLYKSEEDYDRIKRKNTLNNEITKDDNMLTFDKVKYSSENNKNGDFFYKTNSPLNTFNTKSFAEYINKQTEESNLGNKYINTKESIKYYRITVISNYYIYEFKYSVYSYNKENIKNFDSPSNKLRLSPNKRNDSLTKNNKNSFTLQNRFDLKNIEYFLINTDFSQLLIDFSEKRNMIYNLYIQNDTSLKDENNSKNEFLSKVQFENGNSNKNFQKSKQSSKGEFSKSKYVFYQKELNFNLVIILSNLLRVYFSSVKPTIFVPFSEFEFLKYESNRCFSQICNYLNEFSQEFYSKLLEFIPKDKDEKLLKFFPISKIERKFIEIVKRKIIFLTNKKIIEIEEENIQYDNLQIILISKLESINVFPEKSTLQLLHSNGKVSEFFTLNYLNMVKMIKDIYNSNCLIPLVISKKI